MSSSTLELVLEKVKELTPEEQQKVRELLDSFVDETGVTMEGTDKPLVTEEEFQKILLAKGMISKIPARNQDSTAYENRKLLEVPGKTLSEIIIEERR